MHNIPQFEDLSGRDFGEWHVIKRVDDYITAGNNHFTQYECRCSCGTVKKVLANALRSGRSTSCGCVAKRIAKSTASHNFTTHGDSKSRLYKIWSGMLKRCENHNASNYQYYGGRDISVCDSWHSFINFKSWAIKNGYSDSLSIDRIDVNDGYNPDNCRWVTAETQANNRRSTVNITYMNETHSLADWAKIYNIPYKLFHKDIRIRGMSMEEAINKYQSNL